MNRLQTMVQRLKELYEQAVELDTLIAVPVLTLGLLLLHGGSVWYITVPLTVLCILPKLNKLPFCRPWRLWMATQSSSKNTPNTLKGSKSGRLKS